MMTVLREIDGLIAENILLRQQVDDLQGSPANQKKLTEREVSEIRNLSRVSHLTQKEIADIYDVNPATVSRIVRGVYWK